MRPIHLWAATSVIVLAISVYGAVERKADQRIRRMLVQSAVTEVQLREQLAAAESRLSEALWRTEAQVRTLGDKLHREDTKLLALADDNKRGAREGVKGLNDEIRPDLDQTIKQLRRIEAQVARLTVPVPTVRGLTWADLNGKKVKVLGSQLRMDIDALKVMSLRHAPGLRFDPKNLPLPWPDMYLKVFKQEFNPYTFAGNMSAIAQQIREGSGGWSNQIEYLLGQLSKYTNARDEVFYDFDNEQQDGVYKRGWTSALGNANALIGLTELYDATRDEKYLQLARRYLAPLTTTWTEHDIVRLDGSDYLWFEETPPLNGHPVSVYNGHIGTVLALYHWEKVTGDKSVEPYIRAGLATAARYLPESRRPGAIPAYSKFGEVADYGPARAVNMARTLWEITGETVFRDLTDALTTDVPYR